MDRAQFAREWTDALAAPAGRTARGEVVQVVGDALGGVGSRLQFSGHLGSDPDSAVALVASMAGALARGARLLLDQGNAYAAAALVRQVVEVEYLLWTFVDDPADAPRWLHSTKRERLSEFSSRAMRHRSGGTFRWQEYSAHCERGGHPTPRGWPLVVEEPYAMGPILSQVEVARLDLAQHLGRAWVLLVSACDAIDRTPVYSTYTYAVEDSLAAWRRADAAAIAASVPPDL